MTYRDRQRLTDIQAAIEAIRSHLQATVDHDVPELERAVHALIAVLPADEVPPTRSG